MAIPAGRTSNIAVAVVVVAAAGCSPDAALDNSSFPDVSSEWSYSDADVFVVEVLSAWALMLESEALVCERLLLVVEDIESRFGLSFEY